MAYNINKNNNNLSPRIPYRAQPNNTCTQNSSLDTYKMMSCCFRGYMEGDEQLTPFPQPSSHSIYNLFNLLLTSVSDNVEYGAEAIMERSPRICCLICQPSSIIQSICHPMGFYSLLILLLNKCTPEN